MALLRELRSRARAWVPLLLMAATGGCALLARLLPEEKSLAFPHAVHAEEGLECADCHAGAAEADEPGMPAKPQCMLCHEDLDKDKPAEKKVESLFAESGYLAARVSQLEDEVLFSHKSHAGDGGYGLECGACHTGVESNERVGPELAVSMDDCQRCHVERQAANECATCHSEVRPDAKPPSHEENWKRVHGQAVRARSDETADRCALCHSESSCVACHLDTPPDNHNPHWRLRGHGIAAMMDRENCATCHRSDSCERCHAETLPQNHTGMWGGPVDTHCVTCHFPLQANGCIVCHKSTPSHALATPMPPWHNPGMNCRQCHGLTQPLPHVDNGSQCIMCHQ